MHLLKQGFCKDIGDLLPKREVRQKLNTLTDKTSSWRGGWRNSSSCPLWLPGNVITLSFFCVTRSSAPIVLCGPLRPQTTFKTVCRGRLNIIPFTCIVPSSRQLNLSAEQTRHGPAKKTLVWFSCSRQPGPGRSLLPSLILFDKPL